MERCPPELYLKMFSLACTDGGRTGCALSLVSRRIHTASFPVRFHTVALYGVPRIRAFLRGLDSNMSPLPVVHHLFLYDGGEAGQSYLGDNVPSLVASIILAIAPSLITLSGNLTSIRATYANIIPLGTGLPRLQDLSLSVKSRMSDDDLRSLPELRRLHKWGRVYSGLSMMEASVFVRVASRPAQIRLSDLDQTSELCVILKQGASFLGSDEEGQRIQLPSVLERLIIQSSLIRNEDSHLSEVDTMIRANGNRNLLELAEENPTVLVVPECNYTIENCLEDWLDVVEGGQGCWRVPPRKTTSTSRHETMDRVPGS